METQCPVCSSELKIYDGEVDQYCPNINCDARIVQSLSHFVSRNAMNIEGLSISTIETLFENKLVRTINDLYSLENNKDAFLKLDGYKDTSVNNVLSSIENSKSSNLSNLIFGLGIKHIGLRAAKDLILTYSSIEELLSIKYEDLLSIPDFGEVKAKSLSE
ncbi:MAG: hypothetical protein DRP42_06045 [Tenericutes bacterium]|nr:MAG: hypothetical protein DRP42_06045 [Mycoplasmatota bacterium]